MAKEDYKSIGAVIKNPVVLGILESKRGRGEALEVVIEPGNGDVECISVYGVVGGDSFSGRPIMNLERERGSSGRVKRYILPPIKDCLVIR